MNIQPLPLHISLSQRLAEFANGIIEGGKVNEFMWIRLYEDAEKVSQSPEFSHIGYAFISILYALKADKKNWNKYYLKSIAIQPLEVCETELFLPHMSAVDLIAAPMVGAERIKKMARHSNDPWELSCAAGLSLSRCLFESASIAINKLIVMKSDLLSSINYKQFSNIGWLYHNRKIVNEDDLLDRYSVALETVFEETGQLTNNNQIRVMPPGVGAGIQKIICVDEPIEKLIDIDWIIAERITSKFEDPMADVITFSTGPLKE